MRANAVIVGVSLLASIVCGCPSTDPGPEADGGSRDASGGCTADEACSDGLFCTGAERCEPGSADADARGCVTGSPPCGEATCDETDDSCVVACPDADADGHTSAACGGDDCDDGDARRAPSHPEVCDPGLDRDEDCDPMTIGDVDLDGDLHVDATCCNGERCGDDCDDTRPGIFEGASEICNGFDDDCDGMLDEGVRTVFYRDLDGDAFGVEGDTVEDCSRPTGYTLNPGDCADGDETRHPGVRERCDGIDDDCDGTIDERDASDVPCTCTTGSTPPCGPAAETGVCRFGTQTCVDGVWDTCAGAIMPSAESCNGADDDCDASVDEGVLTTWYADLDGDDRGDPTSTITACTAPMAHVAVAGDCNDANPEVYVGHPEICDGIDNNCSSGGGAEPAEDVDGDSYTSSSYSGCTGGFPQTDCDDRVAGANPAASFMDRPYCPGNYPVCYDSRGVHCARGRDGVNCRNEPGAPTPTWDWNCSGASESEPRFFGCSCVVGGPCVPTMLSGFPSGDVTYSAGTPCGTSVTTHGCSSGACMACVSTTTGMRPLRCR